MSDAVAPDHKRLLLLGLLLDGERHGYELNRVVRAHGTLYADLGRANIYYLLERMAGDGLVAVRSQPGTRGHRGARLVYRITEAGRRRFGALLRAELVSYDAIHPGVDVAVVLAGALPTAEVVRLLRERRDVVQARQAEVGAELAAVPETAVLPRIAADHLMDLIDAELAWLDRSLAVLDRDAEKAVRRPHVSPDQP